MPATATRLDISAFSIAASSLLASLKNVVYTFTPEYQEGRLLVRAGKSPQLVKKSATLTTDQYSIISAPVKVTNLNVSAFSVGGTSYKATLRSGTFSGTMEHTTNGSGPDDEWHYPSFVGKDYTANFQIAVPASSFPAIMAAVHGSGASSVQLVFTVTINSVTTTVPMVANSVVWAGEDGNDQMLTVTLGGQDPDTGNYPTASTGTTSLLEKALNAPHTALAISTTTKASNGVTIAGNFLFTGFSFQFAGETVITTNYSFRSQGTITIS